MSPLIPIIFTALASSALGEEGQARILISKQVSKNSYKEHWIRKILCVFQCSVYLQINNKYLVEGMDIVVKYNLYNVGDNAATNVQVDNLERKRVSKMYIRLRTAGSVRRTLTWLLVRRSTSLTGWHQGPTPPTLWLLGLRSLATSTSLLLRY